jgi:tetratricopeptide (TPR) repeat protein
LFVLGLLSKTVIATLPAALLLLIWWKQGRLSWKRDAWPLAPFFLVGLAAGLFTAWFERKVVHAEGGAFDFTLVERCLIAGRAFWFYLGKLVWPAELAFIYPRWQVSQAVWWQYLFPVAALLLLLVCWKAGRQGRGLLTGLLFFAGTLFPALGFFNVYPFRYSFVADHFQYLASVGVIALASVGVALVLRQWRLWGRAGGNLFCLAFLVLLAGLTRRQCEMYTDVETLWRVTLSRSPAAFLAHNNLAVILRARGQVDEAIAHLQKALELQPDFAEAHNNLGNALLQCGQMDAALAHFQRAFEIEPNNALAHANLGSALLRKGRLADAIAQFRKAAAIQPDNLEVLNNLAYALLRNGQLDEAMTLLRRAIELRPGFADAHNNLGNLLLQKGRIQDAIAQYEQTLETQPTNAPAHSNLGKLLLQMGRMEEALAHFERVVELRPDSAEAHNDLANALLRAGRTDNVLPHFERALQLRPDFSEAHNNLALVLLRNGRLDDAISHFREALALEPKNAFTLRNLAQALVQQGHAQEAIVQYQAALSLQPTDAATLNNLAWVLATSPDASARNGSRAVELAQQAERLSGGGNAVVLGTLAAAYAEAGRFPLAVSTATKALESSSAQTNSALADVLRSRIALYESGVPFRDIRARP